MVPKQTHNAAVCPPELDVIDLISGKWTVLVVHLLSDKTMRHSELRRTIGGISQKILTQTLRKLEQNGLVTRKIYPVVPPQVEYSLTPLGRSLTPVLETICTWASEHHTEALQARKTYSSQE